MVKKDFIRLRVRCTGYQPGDECEHSALRRPTFTLLRQAVRRSACEGRRMSPLRVEGGPAVTKRRRVVTGKAQGSRKLFFLVIFCFVFIVTLAPAVRACTLWAAAGERVADKGVLIAKNLDREPGGQIELKFFSSPGNLRFVGIYYSAGLKESIEAGVNEKGLVVASAVVTSIAEAEREIGAGGGLENKLLASFASVDEVLGNRALLQASHPAFYMVADNKKIAVIEIALRGQVSVEVTDNGSLSHTNHYTSDQLKYGNQKVDKNSRARLARIGELMSGRTEALTLDDFKVFSQDKFNGPEDSIFRNSGSAFGEKTLATWIVLIPQNGAPTLYTRLVDSASGERVVNVRLDESFWNKGRL